MLSSLYAGISGLNANSNVMAVIGVSMIKRGSLDEMTEEFGAQIDKRIIKSNKGGKNGKNQKNM